MTVVGVCVGVSSGNTQTTNQPQDLYKTVWEIKQKCVIDQAADRGAYICQSQSLNIHLANPTPAQLTSMHFYSWKKGLKTGMVRGAGVSVFLDVCVDGC